MNDYDKAARRAVKGGAEETRAWLLRKVPKRLKYGRWLDSQSAPRPGEKDRRCDTIMELPDDKGRWWAAIIELFSIPDADALDRGGEYLFRFRRELRHGPHGKDKYNMALVLLFLTTGPDEREISMELPGSPEAVILKPRLMVLSEESALAHVRFIKDNPGLCWLSMWLPLMKGGNTKKVAECWRELASPDVRLPQIADLTLTFARLAGCEDLYKKQMEGIMFMTDPVFDQVRHEQTITIRRQDIEELLKTRFKDKVPTTVFDRVREETDAARLQEWVLLAATAKSAKDFQKKMGSHQPSEVSSS